MNNVERSKVLLMIKKKIEVFRFNIECYLRNLFSRNQFKKTPINYKISTEYDSFITEDFLLNVYYEKFQYSKSRGIDGKNGTDLKIDSYGSRTSDISWIRKQLMNGTYKFNAYQEVLVSKGKGKSPRIIAKATIRDSLVIYTLKEYLKKNIRGSITTKANDLIRDVIQNLKAIEVIEDYIFFQTDIENYYGSIDHNLLTSQIKEMIHSDTKKELILSLIKKIIENDTIEFGAKKPDEKHQNKKGIPQGLSISNILANLYMLELDKNIEKLVKDNTNGLIGYYRYVDDILIICKKDEFKSILCTFKKEISKYKLKLHPEKTQSFDLSKKGNFLDFLGYVISYTHGYKSKHLKLENFIIVPRKKTSIKFLKSILSLFAQFKKNVDEIQKLNNIQTKKVKKNLLKSNMIFRLNISLGGCISNGNRYGFFTYFSQISSPFLAYQVQNLIDKELTKLATQKYIDHDEYNFIASSLKKPITCFYSTQNDNFFKKNIAINFDEFMNYDEYVRQKGKNKTQSEDEYYKSINKKSPADFVKKYDNEYYENLKNNYNGQIYRFKIYYHFNKMKQKNLDILSKDIKASLPY